MRRVHNFIRLKEGIVKWVTRERPKIDRLACPWLIKRFIDPQAEFLYVPPAAVMATAQKTGATPFDVPGVGLTHAGRSAASMHSSRSTTWRSKGLHEWLRSCVQPTPIR
jgi:hypothetical protein